jgi:RNA polymerase primary sigma factor
VTETTADPDEQRSLGRQLGRPTIDPQKASEVLDAWQLAGYRGYSVVEKRSERRLIALTLIAALTAENQPFDGLLLTADDVARDQWQQLLIRDGRALEGWAIQTNDELLADGGTAKSGCIVIADELDSYLTEDLAAALTRSRAVLGLCGSPAGLGEALHLRKFIGKALNSGKPVAKFDVQSLLDSQHRESDEAIEDPAEAREQVLSPASLENSLGIYLSQIQKVSLLTAEEEIELAKRIEAGLYATQKITELADRGVKLPVRERRDMQWVCRDGDRAKNHFIEANLRLVYQIARKYSRRMEILDLIQEGNLGLLRAVEKFDHARGFKFSTYATWWIRQAITRAIADKANLIRIPVHMVESDSPVLTERRRRFDEGESTRARDVAAELGLDVDDVEAAINRHRRPHSLELMAEGGIDLVDRADRDSHEHLTFSLFQDQLQLVLETLSEREAGVVRLRFGLTDGQPRTLDEIGQVYGVTRERIRQIESKTMLKLRHRSRSAVLADYFEGVFDPDLVTDDSDL